MNAQASMAIFHPTIAQVQGLLGKWVVAGVCHPDEAPFEVGPYRVVGLVIPSTSDACDAQILVDPWVDGSPSPFGFDSQLFFETTRYLKLVPQPIFETMKSM